MTTEDGYEVEWCTNEEWLATIGAYECEDPSRSSALSDSARETLERIYVALTAVDEVSVVDAMRGRSLFHGWNGAHWTWQYGPVGTFAELPDELRSRLERIIDDES